MAAYRLSKTDVEEARREFEGLFSDLRGVVGTGIGLNRSRDDLALTVMVSDERTARRIPSQLKGVDIVVEMVGEIDAY